MCIHSHTSASCQEDGNHVTQRILSCIRKTVGYSRLTEQITKHQHTNQSCYWWQEQRNNDCCCNWEYQTLKLGNSTELRHLNLALLLSGAQLHDRWLNQWNQRHIGIRRHGYRT